MIDLASHVMSPKAIADCPLATHCHLRGGKGRDATSLIPAQAVAA